MGIFGKPKAEVVLGIEGMSCGHCVAAVEKTIMSVEGVKKVDVDLKSKRATVVAEPGKVNVEAYIAKVKEAGYEAKEISVKGK